MIKEEGFKTSKLEKKVQSMHEQLVQMMKEKDKPTKQFTLNIICPFPLDKDLFMPPFPKGLEIPKHDKYFNTSNPQDHLRESSTLSIDFMHDHVLTILKMC